MDWLFVLGCMKTLSTNLLNECVPSAFICSSSRGASFAHGSDTLATTCRSRAPVALLEIERLPSRLFEAKWSLSRNHNFELLRSKKTPAGSTGRISHVHTDLKGLAANDVNENFKQRDTARLCRCANKRCHLDVKLIHGRQKVSQRLFFHLRSYGHGQQELA